MQRIPATIVTGFLGAGKTSLGAATCWRSRRGNRLAVIVNEFGELGIDREVLLGCGDAVCARRRHRRTRQRLPVLHGRRTNSCRRCARSSNGRRRPTTSSSNLRPRPAEAAGRGLCLAGVRTRMTVDGGVDRDRRRRARRRPLRPTIPRRSPRSGRPTRRSTTTTRSPRCLRSALLRRHGHPEQDRSGRRRRSERAARRDRGLPAARGAARRRPRRQGSGRGCARPRCRRRGRPRRPPVPCTRPRARTITTISTASSSPAARSPNPRASGGFSGAVIRDHDVLRVKGFVEVPRRDRRLLIQSGRPSASSIISIEPGTRTRRRRGRLVVIGRNGIDRAAIAAAIEG